MFTKIVFSLLSAAGNHHCTLCFYEFHYSRSLVERNHTMVLFVTDYFTIVLSSQFICVVCDRISLLYKAESHSITCMYLTLFIRHLSLDTWTTSTFWPFWIMLLWKWVCKYVFVTQLSILLCLYSEVDQIDHTVILSLILKALETLHGGCTILHPHQRSTNVPMSPHPCQHM